MAHQFRYAAFVSYSSKDAHFAKRLHRALESYGIPTSLGKFELLGDRGKKNRIYPVFRDREELSAGNLGERIESSLRASGALIVVCSPHAAASPWVQKEIEYFVGLARNDRIFAIIAREAPLRDASGGDATAQCFPPMLSGHAIADPNALEPLAADARRGKDGFRNAWLKIVAGLIGVTPGQLTDRDKKRRRSRLVRNTTIATLAVLGVAVAAFTESEWRPELYAYFNQEKYYDIAFTGPAGVYANSIEHSARGVDVVLNGVAIGSVASLSLDPEDPNSVIARVGVPRDVMIFANARAELHAAGPPTRLFIAIDVGFSTEAPLPGGTLRGPAPRLVGAVQQNLLEGREPLSQWPKDH